MTAELKGIHAKTFQDLDVIKDVLKLDEEKIAELEKENAELELKLEALEGQIEKMKCWCNCKNYISCLEECCRKNISFEKGVCYNCKKWQLRR